MIQLRPPQFLATIKLNFQDQASALPIHSSDPESGFWDFMSTLLSATLTVAALILFLYLIIAGFEWITAGGDKGKVESARQRITNGITGILVLASAVALLMIVQSILEVDLIQINGGGAPPPGGGGPGRPPTQ